jgi:LPS export ABC transporter permease LptG/LPS export ABC transporter permease LptF
MLKALDRYLLREMVLPLFLGLAVLTFLLQVQPFMLQSQLLLAKGVPWTTILSALWMLVPQALSVTIPMAVLLGILVGFGRLAADREFVAMQACGVSVIRLLRPVVLVALVGTAATAYETIVALPDANLKFREMALGVVAQELESDVKPQVFFQNFPNHVIYVRDLPPGGGWRDVFVAETDAATTRVYFAREGRVVLDHDKRLVQLQLTDGTSYTTNLVDRETADSTEFQSLSVNLDPSAVFPPPPAKGAPEMTFAELRADIKFAQDHGDPAYIDRFMVQEKFALPATCLILALIGLALGTSNRKDGKLASFVLGFGVILIYYILLYGARAFATGGKITPELAPWIPIIVMGIAGVAMMAWRVRAADQPIRLSIPTFWRRNGAAAPAGPLESTVAAPAAPRTDDVNSRRIVVVLRVPHLNLPLPHLLDLYVAREYLRVLVLSIVSFLGIFYISTFIDLVDKLFRGQATAGLLFRYFYFQTPQFIYYVIPMAVLVSCLVTIGVMTKNSELMVMRACGISLYRTAAPLLVFGLCASGILFVLNDKVLAASNREADRLNRQIRSWAPLISSSTRRWVSGTNGDIYHYDIFDPVTDHFSRLWVYHADVRTWRLKSMSYADDVAFQRPSQSWRARSGWDRQFNLVQRNGGEHIAVKYEPFSERVLPVAPPTYFKTDVPDPEQMTYTELRQYIVKLRDSGADVVPSVVALDTKIAFPLVTLIMTLIAVPFAVTTGRRGALYGIGVGIVLAMVYWIALSVFAALGSGGLLTPGLAAWAPNILFGAAAVYLILTVRT